MKSIIYRAVMWCYRHFGTLTAPPRAPCPADPLIEILGFHGEVLGIGETARQFDKVLKHGGCDSRALELGLDLRLPRGRESDEPPPGLLISHVNPVELLAFFLRKAPERLRRCAQVGYWVWELETTPSNWRHTERLVDAIWTPSAFAARALKAGLGERVSIDVLPPPIFATIPSDCTWPDAERSDGKVRILAVCDLRSSAVRKNPFGAIEAFEALRRDSRNQAQLVLKVVGAVQEPGVFAQLKARVGSHADISLVQLHLSDRAMLGLIKSCDIALSLHRSEGFGLLAAHAAYLGRPVVATAWSAPLEYLSPDGAQLVDFMRVPVVDPQKIYPAGQSWAEPDLDDAVQKLEELVRDADKRRRMGEAAGRLARERLGPDAWWAQYRRLVAKLVRSTG